ncbi:MAG TPA: HlyD family efflux transporter periplasmic adaptor subunit [Gemmatimonadales bacterium]|nr:HlyD family efflux transporter periplasmic adaptor subunit [Gemmatimonadales bacterium]
MDIARAPKRKTGRMLAIGAGVLALVAITVALTNLEPRARAADRASLLIDSVSRGEMVRSVRAPGTLVPERIVIISAVTAGRVEELPLRPGVTVTAETVIATLSNPDVELQRLEAERQLTSAEAQYLTLRTQLETQRMSQESALAAMRTQFNEAARQKRLFDSLDARGLASTNEVQAASDRMRELSERVQLEERQLSILLSSVDEQLALQRAQIERMRAIRDFNDERVASMRVTAGEAGVLTELPLELGQWVVPGERLARVAQPGELMAVLRVPATQARDVVQGQNATIDTRNGIIQGHVMRVDPVVQNGTVTVEVALDGELPQGARADLSVDGVIELQRLEDVLYVQRPYYGQADGTVSMFRLEPDGKHAIKVPVALGASSVSVIEVKSGLQVGDRVIVSDMSQFDDVERVRLQ